VLFVAQALLGIPVFIILVLGLVALSVPAVAALIDLPDIGTLMTQATDSSEGLVGSVASTASALLSLAFAMLGAAHLRRSRLGAYRWLERSVLFGQVLPFWQDQLAAMVQLVWSLLLLAALRYAIRQEEARLGLELIRDSADAWH
jgi:EamA domain-containing membrane protein RarD